VKIMVDSIKASRLLDNDRVSIVLAYRAAEAGPKEQSPKQKEISPFQFDKSTVDLGSSSNNLFCLIGNGLDKGEYPALTIEALLRCLSTLLTRFLHLIGEVKTKIHDTPYCINSYTYTISEIQRQNELLTIIIKLLNDSKTFTKKMLGLNKSIIVVHDFLTGKAGMLKYAEIDAKLQVLKDDINKQLEEFNYTRFLLKEELHEEIKEHKFLDRLKRDKKESKQQKQTELLKPVFIPMFLQVSDQGILYLQSGYPEFIALQISYKESTYNLHLIRPGDARSIIRGDILMISRDYYLDSIFKSMSDEKQYYEQYFQNLRFDLQNAKKKDLDGLTLVPPKPNECIPSPEFLLFIHMRRNQS